MFEVTTTDASLDCFALSRRPLKVFNCNTGSVFEDCQTRVPIQSSFYELRRNVAKNEWECEIPDQNESNDIKVNDLNDKNAVLSDHFVRDFRPISFPNSNNLFTKYLYHNGVGKLPHWFCDLPSSILREEPKMYLNDAMEPLFKRELPFCENCKKKLEYPFYTGFNAFICTECFSNGFIPPHMSTFDFYKVEDPEKSNRSWTLSETNKLLTLIEEHGDNWFKIADLMKTRTATECLLHFVRIPMYDQYYIADPLLVPKGDIPSEPNILPFMIAQDPIAAYVEFIHSFIPQIGSIVAETSQKNLEEILSSKSGILLYNQIPSILRNLIKLTGEEAGKVALSEAQVLLSKIRECLRLLEKENNTLHRDLDNWLKELNSSSFISEDLLQNN